MSTRIVAIHGFLGCAADWAALRGELLARAPELKFETVELFSKPTSKETTQKEISALEWAKRFNRLQKNRHLERNILLGYSLGGRLALQAVYDKPGLWDEVVLLSAHPGLRTEQEKIARRNSDRDWAEKFLNLPWQHVVKLWNDQPVFVQSHTPPRNSENLSREELASALVNWSLADHDFAPDQLIPLKGKLHWLAGENDAKYLSLFQDLKSAGIIEDLSTVEDAGHRAHLDNPAEVARLLVQKLDLV